MTQPAENSSRSRENPVRTGTRIATYTSANTWATSQRFLKVCSGWIIGHFGTSEPLRMGAAPLSQGSLSLRSTGGAWAVGWSEACL